jgi:hypothetical protein
LIATTANQKLLKFGHLKDVEKVLYVKKASLCFGLFVGHGVDVEGRVGALTHQENLELVSGINSCRQETQYRF